MLRRIVLAGLLLAYVLHAAFSPAAGAPLRFCRIGHLSSVPSEFTDRTAAKAFFVTLNKCGSPPRSADIQVLYQADRGKPTRIIAQRQNVATNLRDGQDGSIFGEIVPAGEAFIRVNSSGFVLAPGCYTVRVAIRGGEVGELSTCTSATRFQLDSRRDRDHRNE